MSNEKVNVTDMFLVYEDDNGFHTERQMVVEGKSFYVKSFFPSVPKATPTNQLIKLIDNNAKVK